MAKEIKFNVKLEVDGKERLVTATSSVAQLRAGFDAAKDGATRLRDALITFNQTVDVLRTAQDAVGQLADTLNAVTEESEHFAEAMAAANTMAGKSGDDFDALKDKVAELAKTIPVARDLLANGLYQTISNGVPEDNWLTYLEQSAKASVGGLANLEEVVKVTSTMIKNYGLAWSDAGLIQDKIQMTAVNGVTSFEQLAQALPRVAANASTLGVTVDELMASFATLTGVSGNTAEVSTQLAAIFTALIKPSSEATKMAQEMGIQFNAASIKAAGGMQNFLTSLSQSVTEYAKSSGKLEQEVYGRLFGSAESLRALTPLVGKLSDKFAENVDAMADSAGTIETAFGTMADTSASKLQLLKNSFAKATDGIASAMEGLKPVLNITSQVGNSALSIMVLSKSMQKLSLVLGVAKARTLAVGVACNVARNGMVGLTAVTRTLRAAFTGASVGATTLKVAIRSLLITTGVGAAFVALTSILSAFAQKSADAQARAEALSESMDGMDEAADNVKDAYDNTLKSTYDDLIAKYGELKAGWDALSTEQQKMAWIKNNQSAFNELCIKIGNVTDAEEIFNRKTDAVVDAFKQRAMAAAYAAKLTALYQKQISLSDKKQKIAKDIADDAKQSGRSAKEGDIVPEGWRSERYGKVGGDGKWRFTKEGSERYSGTNVSGNGQILGIDKEIASVGQEIASTQKQLADQLKSVSDFVEVKKPATAAGSSNGTNGTGGNADAPKTYVEQLRAQLSAAQKEMENATTIDARVQASAKIKDIQTQIDEATKGKVSIEAEAEPTYIKQGSDADKRKSHDNAGQRINSIQQDYEIGIIGKDEAEKQIADINRQLTDLGLKPVEVHFKTVTDELQEQLAAAQREFDEAVSVDAKVKAAAKVADIQTQIDEATNGKVTIKADVEPSYIEQGSSADKRQSYSNAQTKASRIQQDYEIGLIGKDEAEQQIAELNGEIAALDGNLKPLKLELDVSGFNKAMDGIKSGWSSIQGIGNGIQSITDALEDNGDAWKQITGVINGFLSIASGIQGIVTLIQLLTGATTAHTVATGADMAATTADAAEKTVAATATAPVVAANKLATASYLELASATYFAAHAYIPFAGFGIAAGFATAAVAMTEAIGMMAFATGGIVPGTSRSGDKVIARVNSGEMILNAAQQARLFAIANGNYQPPTFYKRQLQPVTVQNFSSGIEPARTEVNVHLNANARKMFEMMSDVKRVTSKSGRKYAI